MLGFWAMKKKYLKIAINIVLAVLGILAVVTLWNTPFVLLGMVLLLIVVVFVLQPSRNVLAVFLFAALLGPMAEMLCVQAGAWRYTNPQFFGIPVWLPFLWGLFGMAVYELSIVLQKRDS